MKQEKTSTPAEIDTEQQAQAFDKAMAFFNKRDFAKAMPLFEQAGEGPVTEMAHVAKMHARMCERRLGGAQPVLQTPEDQYNYAIGLLNQGRVDDAAQLLRKAIAGREDADHYHYALALASGLKGEMESSANHLRKAIELQPANRVNARNDPEFAPLAQHPLIREVLNAS
ncbi:MAG: hypothetical protein U0Q16_32110 [Bryobacteraceae bacterium]